MTSQPMPQLEICIGGIEDAIIASQAGADRVELCSATEIGGLTPSLATLRQVRAAVDLPIMAMVRPRGGGFHYTDNEFAIMLAEAQLCTDAGADGIVFGCFTADGELDIARCQAMVKAAADHDVVFHRAFDFLPDPLTAACQLRDLGVTRVLTSGQQPTAEGGIALLKQLAHEVGTELEIMPGGGVDATNVVNIVQQTSVAQVHAGVATMISDRGHAADLSVSLGGADSPPEGTHRAVSKEKLDDLIAVMRNTWGSPSQAT